MSVYDFLAVFGGFYLVHGFVKVIKSFFIRYVAKTSNPDEYGDYVVVTGATDGIGKAIAVEFAKKNMNLILISRTQSKLDAVEKEIMEQVTGYKGTIKTLGVDYSANPTLKSPSPVEDPEQNAIFSGFYAEVEKLFDSINGELGILVNNVGMSYDFPMFFHELGDKEAVDLINLNVASTTLMTKIFLKQVVEKGPQRKAAVINIGSFSGLMASPLLSEYSAAKAYIQRLTEGLACEYADSRIEFQCHVPLYIVSKLSKFRKPSLTVPSAEQYAQSVLAYLGKRSVVVSGSLVHQLMTFFATYMPRSMYLKYVKNMHAGIRKKGFAKRRRKLQ